MAHQRRLQDAGVVDDQHVAGAEEVRQIADHAVLQPAFRSAHHQQAGGIPRPGRTQCDKVLRQLEIEVRHVHAAPIAGNEVRRQSALALPGFGIC